MDGVGPRIIKPRLLSRKVRDRAEILDDGFHEDQKTPGGARVLEESRGDEDDGSGKGLKKWLKVSRGFFGSTIKKFYILLRRKIQL